MDESAEIITRAINELRALDRNNVEIAIELMGAIVPVLIEAAGTQQAGDFLHRLADNVHILQQPH